MTFLSQKQIDGLGFKKLGKNVLISDKASIYNPELMEIGDNSRIDEKGLPIFELNIFSEAHKIDIKIEKDDLLTINRSLNADLFNKLTGRPLREMCCD